MGARLGRASLVIAIAIAGAACADDGPQVGLPETTFPASASTAPAPTTEGAGTAPATTDTAGTASASTAPASTEPRSSEPPPSTAPPSTAPPTTTQPADPATPRAPLANAGGESASFNGIGRLDGFGSACTAFLLDVGPPSGPAYAMTNGHCVGLADTASVVRDQPVDGVSVRFSLFADAPSDVAVVPVATVRYATMRGTDVAILELDSTRSGVIGLAAYGLAEPPSSGDEVRVVGVPVDALEPTEQVLRGATCTASATSRVVESDSVWDDAVSTDCAGIVSGSAGSPVLGTGTSPRVAAIVNTTSIGATDGTTCALGQPCEVSSTGAAMVANRTYAVPVEEWAACFSPSWDPSAPGCPTEPAPATVDAPVHDVPPGATWAATIGGGTGGPYVAKAGPVASTDCRDAAGYALTATTFDQPVGLLDGVYVLCAASLDARNAPDTTQAGNAIMVIAASTPS